VVTVPRSVPYHPDPIDTMFRLARTVGDLAAYVVKPFVVTCCWYRSDPSKDAEANPGAE
jgi:hypothetical protein